MPENPYRPPKMPPERRVGLVLSAWFVASIPAAFVCGGMTCYAVGVTGEVAAKIGGYEQNAAWREAGWNVGIPIALVVTSALIALAAWHFRSRR